MSGTWVEVIRSVALVDTVKEHPVTWTLVYEVRFYLLIAVVLLTFRHNMSVGLAIGSFVLVMAIYFTQYNVLPVSFSSLVYTTFGTGPRIMYYEFLFGIAVGALCSLRIRAIPRTMVATGVLWIVGTATLVTLGVFRVDDCRILGYGVPAAMILYGVIVLEQKKLIRVPSFLVMAGDASYSVYLWHIAILSVLVRCWAGHGVVGAAGYIISGLLAVALIGQASFFVIEKPLMRLARNGKARAQKERAIPAEFADPSGRITSSIRSLLLQA